MLSLLRLPTGALLTSCGRSRETVVKNYHPSLVCFWRISTFLGISGDLDPDLIWPHLVVGSSFGTLCCFEWDPLLSLYGCSSDWGLVGPLEVPFLL